MNCLIKTTNRIIIEFKFYLQSKDNMQPLKNESKGNSYNRYN